MTLLKMLWNSLFCPALNSPNPQNWLKIKFESTSFEIKAYDDLKLQWKPGLNVTFLVNYFPLCPSLQNLFSRLSLKIGENKFFYWHVKYGHVLYHLKVNFVRIWNRNRKMSVFGSVSHLSLTQNQILSPTLKIVSKKFS